MGIEVSGTDSRAAGNRIEPLLQFFLSTPDLIQMLGEETYCKALGKILSTALGVEGQNIPNLLYNIPSETSFGERALLFNLFSLLWSGNNDVLEVGPFFGGTSRAIALGMLNNVRRQPDTKLLTYDKFEYGTGEYLSELLKPLCDRGTISKERYQEIQQQVEMPSFLEVFHEIHQKESYYPLISAHQSSLPDSKEEVLSSPNLLKLSPELRFDAVFVDGCKSWYGTKYFMQQCAPLTTPGAFMIFQDYGWYTCFWIPAFTESLSGYFQFICSVDSTYVFVLTKPLTAEIIDLNFPDEADLISEFAIDHLFKSLINRAIQRNDFRGLVFGKIQHAAALAYTGNKARAKSLLLALAEEDYALPYLNIVNDALKSPTYRAGVGSIELDN